MGRCQRRGSDGGQGGGAAAAREDHVQSHGLRDLHYELICVGAVFHIVLRTRNAAAVEVVGRQLAAFLLELHAIALPGQGPNGLHVQGSGGAIGVRDFDLKSFHQELSLVAHDATGQGSLAAVLKGCRDFSLHLLRQQRHALVWRRHLHEAGAAAAGQNHVQGHGFDDLYAELILFGTVFDVVLHALDAAATQVCGGDLLFADRELHAVALARDGSNGLHVHGAALALAVQHLDLKGLHQQLALVTEICPCGQDPGSAAGLCRSQFPALHLECLQRTLFAVHSTLIIQLNVHLSDAEGKKGAK
mmetsp:Transcript_34138/g.54676  ORF Transcript_34138/g.54676 Transcript_34138/m.54676 type:complete len:303 (+) Transcript_34138:416-1324(+)